MVEEPAVVEDSVDSRDGGCSVGGSCLEDSGTIGQVHVLDVAEHLSFVLLNNLVNDEHDQLPERSCGGRGYHRNPRLLKFET